MGMRGQPLKLPGIFLAKSNNRKLTKFRLEFTTEQAGTPMAVPEVAEWFF
jgi:hypothetical protein